MAKQATGDRRQATGNRRPEAGSRKPVAGFCRSLGGGWSPVLFLLSFGGMPLFCIFGVLFEKRIRKLLIVITRQIVFDNIRNIFDLDDLIFEDRNREYGAYQLRKKYNRVVGTGIIMASALAAIIVIWPFAFAGRKDRVVSGNITYIPVQMESLDPPSERIIVPPAPPPPGAERVQEVVKYVPPVVVDTVMPEEAKTTTTDDLMVQTTREETDAISFGSDEEALTGQDGIESDEAFFLVEVMPSFRGGDINKFREWVQKRTNYPQAAIEAGLQGKVYLTFIIEPDGSVSNVTVVKGVAPLIDNEAVKAIQESPRWSPGLQRGQPVRVRYSMWLNFVF